MKSRRAEPLRVTVKDGALTISIGVETLAWAFEREPQGSQPLNEKYDGEDENLPEFVQKYLITNPGGFAMDVKRAMEDEEEDGNTELNKFLDRMCEAAMEDGSEFACEPEDMPADNRSFDDRAKDWRKAKKGKSR